MSNTGPWRNMTQVSKSAHITGWFRRYQAALRQSLKQSGGASLPLATKLGRQAVALEMETLDVARCHEQSLMTLVAPGGARKATPRMFKRGDAFFAETIIPIEQTHRAARKADVRITQLTQVLRRRTAKSVESRQHLKTGIARRQAVEAALTKSRKHFLELLKKSNLLQQRLRAQTRAMLSAQEKERQKTSRQLHDEIAQELLAINVRLLILKTLAETSTDNLTKDIAGTQRLVQKSVQMFQQAARDLDVIHET